MHLRIRSLLPTIRQVRFGSGDIPRAGGKFGEREHAQEEQYFRKKEREEIERYRDELDKTAKKQQPKEQPPKK